MPLFELPGMEESPEVSCDPPTQLLWRSQSAADQGQWERALELVREARAIQSEAAVLREFESETLVRLGRADEARALLESTPKEVRTEEESWRLHWLSSPGTCSESSGFGTLLHPIYHTRRIERTRLMVVGEVESTVLEQVLAFHRREFSGATIEVTTVGEHPPLESFEVLRARLDVGAEPPWMMEMTEAEESRNPGTRAVMLVFARADSPTAYSAGFGAPGLAVLSLMPGDPFQATVVAHELYHSLLDLQHTNGYEGPLDLTSVMGPLGLRTPLSHTYICPSHLESVSVDEETQSLVERGLWAEALDLNPSYLGAYSSLARELLGQGRAEEAMGALQRWFERDPGPEAAAELGALILNLGRDPSPYFFRCRGHGMAANTHLYLAQACIDVCRFELAVDELERARALEPGNLHVVGMLGWAHHCLGNAELAEQLYLEALDYAPDWESVRARLAWLRGEEYEPPFPDPDLLWVASFTRAAGAGESLVGLREARCLLRRGQLLAESGRGGEAEVLFEECVLADPVGIHGKVARAWLCYQRGLPEAREWLEAAIRVWPLEPAAGSLKARMSEIREPNSN